MLYAYQIPLVEKKKKFVLLEETGERRDVAKVERVFLDAGKKQTSTSCCMYLS